MKTRIIVAVIAIPLLVLAVFLAPVWVLGAVVGVIAACSAWEFVKCAEGEVKPRLLVYAAVFAFATPFCVVFFPAARVYEIGLFLLFAVMMLELMLSFRHEQTMEFETTAVVLMGAGVMPVLLSGIVRLAMRDDGSVYALLPFVVAFSCDSGAYFTGLFFGKHKLAPRLSPHKTIEGSAGGFFLAILLTMIYGLILKAADYEVDMKVMAVYGFLGALACQIGDLSFSTVKRLCGVKDYGNIIPGNGGMLDRFDSMFWTAAVIELLVSWVPAIEKLAV